MVATLRAKYSNIVGGGGGNIEGMVRIHRKYFGVGKFLWGVKYFGRDKNI